MTDSIVIALIGAVTTVLVGTSSLVFSWLTQRDKAAMNQLQRKVARLRKEVIARIHFEIVANEEHAKAIGKTAKAAQLDLRDRAEERSGTRPEKSLNDRDLVED
jgi:ABC-type uncharacterized transport system permease subunit